MIIKSLFAKSLPAALLLTFMFTTAVAQSPILPFPVQAPKRLSSQPFLQQNQVIVGPASVIQVPQRTYVAPAIQTPVVTAPILKTTSEYDMFNIDLRKELAYQSRIERLVQTNRDINSFVSTMIQSLGNSGWSANWQGTRANSYVTDFYHTGGQHLRLEVENVNSGTHQVLLYTF